MVRIITILILLIPCLVDCQTFTNMADEPITNAACELIPLDVTIMNDPMLDTSFGIEEICIAFTHEVSSDFTFSMVSPSGLEILLSEKNGSNYNGSHTFCFNVNGTESIASTSTPFQGDLIPEGEIGLFNSNTLTANGQWQLKVCDELFFFSGKVDSFSMTFGDQPIAVYPLNYNTCLQAKELVPSLGFQCEDQTFGTLTGSTPSGVNGSCNSDEDFDDDAWFSFIANNAYLNIEISGIIGNNLDLIYQILTGTCNNLTEYLCHNDPDGLIELSGLTINQRYYIRIASMSDVSAENVGFNICIRQGTAPAPANDDCVNAITLPYDPISCNLTNATVAGADNDDSIPFSCSGSGAFTNDVWFKFQAQRNSLNLSIENIAGTTTSLDIQLLEGPSCNALIEKNCFGTSGDNSTAIIELIGLSIGSTYYIRIATFSNAPQNTTFDLCLIDIPSPPSNDNYTAAINLPDVTGSCNLINGTLLGAEASSQANECDFNIAAPFDDDVWFSFNPTSSVDTISIINIEGTTDDLIYEIWVEGGGGSLSSFLCQDDPDVEIALAGMNTNRTYYVRIASYLDNAQNTTFRIGFKRCYQRVCNNKSEGAMTLRHQISCSPDNAQIIVDQSLEELFLNTPTIEIQKNMTLSKEGDGVLKLINQDNVNSLPLISIGGNVNWINTQFIGTTTDAFKIKVMSEGVMRILDSN